MKKMILSAVIVPLLLACNANDENNNETKYEQLPDAQPIVLKLSQKTKSDNLFAFDLFKTTCRVASDENIFISPLSISMALNMTLNGANGETAKEMLTALRAEKYTMEEINEYSRSLSAALVSVDPSTEFSIANSIWHRENFSVKPLFLDVNRINYNAEVKSLDFTSPDAVRQINHWCATHTNDKIKEIIDKIPNDAMMYLVNAIYFKGIWLSQFDKKQTAQENFHTENGKTQKVDMMRQTQQFNYTEDENAQYLELPYGNKAFSMIVMLPREGKTTQDVINNLDNNHWNQWMEHSYGANVNLRLPRFKKECKYESEMKEVLMQMGMQLPFSDFADFSGISDSSLTISRVIHKTFVEVNEEGTEAAAVTVVESKTTSIGPGYQPIDFHVNKPFVFAIYEKSTGIILFFGKIGGFN